MLPEKPSFKIDENLPISVADILVEAGYDTHTVYQEQVQGMSDAGIASICREESRILITLDLDFSDIRAYPPDEHPGFIVLRLRSHSISHISTVIRRILGMFATDGFATVTLERNGLTLVVKRVPARVCQNCGEEYIDDDIASQLFKTAEDAAKSGAEFDVRHYLKAA